MATVISVLTNQFLSDLFGDCARFWPLGKIKIGKLFSWRFRRHLFWLSSIGFIAQTWAKGATGGRKLGYSSATECA